MGSSYFYPRPPRGGRLEDLYGHDRWMAISIHALREEGDCQRPLRAQTAQGISIHALREEGDSGAIPAKAVSPIFLSTPSARRATTPSCARGAQGGISIHALREEGDGVA